MHDTFKELIANQYEATFCTLNQCLQECPSAFWQEPVSAFPFSQCIFHALFFADLYLGKNMEVQPEQAFHKTNAAIFAGYEQLERVTPVGTYEKQFLEQYLGHCRTKAKSVMGNETEEEWKEPAGFPWLASSSRAEVHVYNIRHIQHHAAQLILHLRKEATFDLPWVKSGWDEGSSNG